MKEAHPRAHADRALKGHFAKGKDKRRGKQTAETKHKILATWRNKRAAKQMMAVKTGKAGPHADIRFITAPQVIKAATPDTLSETGMRHNYLYCGKCSRVARNAPELARFPCSPVHMASGRGSSQAKARIQKLEKQLKKEAPDSEEAQVIREFLAVVRPEAATHRRDGGH